MNYFVLRWAMLSGRHQALRESYMSMARQAQSADLKRHYAKEARVQNGLAILCIQRAKKYFTTPVDKQDILPHD